MVATGGGQAVVAVEARAIVQGPSFAAGAALAICRGSSSHARERERGGSNVGPAARGPLPGRGVTPDRGEIKS